MRKIGIYGGAFNPPTRGHSHVIKSVLETDVVDEIWVIPSLIHYHGKNMAPYDLRVKMCERAFLEDPDSDPFSEEQVKIKKFEAAFAELVPEYDGSTESMMKNLRKHRYEDYYLIIGQDNADSIETWKNGDMLIQNEQFIVLPRPDKNEMIEDPFTISEMENILREGHAGKELTPYFGKRNVGKSMFKWYYNEPNIFLHDIKLVNLSSTMARELRCNLAELKKVVCQLVMNDIIVNKLYIRGE